MRKISLTRSALILSAVLALHPAIAQQYSALQSTGDVGGCTYSNEPHIVAAISDSAPAQRQDERFIVAQSPHYDCQSKCIYDNADCKENPQVCKARLANCMNGCPKK